MQTPPDRDVRLLESPDIVLVGSGIMSATLGVMLKRLDPRLRIQVVEAAKDLASEASDGWNNAGTGHAGICEISYTPARDQTGGVPIGPLIVEADRQSPGFDGAASLVHGLLGTSLLASTKPTVCCCPACSRLFVSNTSSSPSAGPVATALGLDLTSSSIATRPPTIGSTSILMDMTWPVPNGKMAVHFGSGPSSAHRSLMQPNRQFRTSGAASPRISPRSTSTSPLRHPAAKT